MVCLTARVSTMKLTRRRVHSASSFSIPPKDLFIAIVVSYPAFMFQANAVLAFGEALLFYLAASYKSGRFRFITPVFMFIGIAGFNLLTPIGRVLMRIGEFPITLGALLLGIRKASILSGMVQLSKIAVDKNLKLPGKFGEFTELVFGYFQAIMVKPPTLRGENLLERIDEHIAFVYNNQGSLSDANVAISTENLEKKDMVRQRTLLVIVVIFLWILLLLGRILPSYG